MSLSSRITTAAFRLGLVLALSAPVTFVGAQSPTATSSTKPKALGPRPLPGAGSWSPQSGPTSDDIVSSESTSKAKVPLYRPVSVQRPGAAMQSSGSHQAAALEHSDRAKIIAIRRRGTFPIPTSAPSEAAPVLVNETNPTSAAVEPVPAALPPGKIRIIPKEMIKIGTPVSNP